MAKKKNKNGQNGHTRGGSKKKADTVKNQSDDYKEHMKEPWLKAFRETGTIIHASLQVDVSRQTIMNWREKDEEFNRKFIEADAEVTEKIEGPALQRVVNGKPVFLVRNGQNVLDAQGNPVVLYREYSEDLVKFMLSRRNRKKYGEKIEVELSGEFALRFASEMVAIIKRNVPANCPHCNNNLAIAPKIAKELETISAKMMAQ